MPRWVFHRDQVWLKLKKKKKRGPGFGTQIAKDSECRWSTYLACLCAKQQCYTELALVCSARSALSPKYFNFKVSSFSWIHKVWALPCLMEHSRKTSWVRVSWNLAMCPPRVLNDKLPGLHFIQKAQGRKMVLSCVKYKLENLSTVTTYPSSS